MLVALALMSPLAGAEQGANDQSRAPLPTLTAAPPMLPTGSIVAFMPRMGSGDYSDMASLRRWLDRQGWAICDGSKGTPDLRNRMLLGTTQLEVVGQRLGEWEHDHRVRGDSDAPVRRNRSTPIGRQKLKQIPNDQHRHGIDITSDRSKHLPPSMRVLFIMRIR
jgi:hypothetical protein